MGQLMRGISVVMPAYNCQKTIRTALKSVLRSLSDIDELVLVNDGSTDDTLRIASELQDRRLKVVSNPKNLGIAVSLNKGISSARHDLICRADADDSVPIWRFPMQRRLFEACGVDFLFGSQILLWKGIPLFPIHTFTNRGKYRDICNALSIACLLPHPTMMARKEAILNLRGYRPVVAEDYELWLRASLDGYKIFRHWFPQNLYRLSRDSVSKKDASNQGHLSHLSNLRLALFGRSTGFSNTEILPKMRAFRRKIMFSDPLLFLETGLLTDPLNSITTKDI